MVMNGSTEGDKCSTGHDSDILANKDTVLTQNKRYAPMYSIVYTNFI